MTADTTIVIPTLGRPSLGHLLHALDQGTCRPRHPVVVVDDRPGKHAPALQTPVGLPVVALRSGGRGPAAARNLGWRSARTPWVSFLDDDVVPEPGWYAALVQDLTSAPSGVAGSQGRVHVPMPASRRPTDWERSTRGLQDASWITADMSYRRGALAEVGGFDERFPRAYREDTDLALRMLEHHWALTGGRRVVTHPVRPADGWVSVRQQAGNADDMLMTVLHGRDWRERAGAASGRRRRHVAITVAALATAALTARRRPLPATASWLAWLVGSGELAWARIAPGPRDPAEVRRMLVTSAAIPLAATWHTARGAWRHRRATPWRGIPDAVLFDRDGTLVHDVPYNGNPERVRPVAGAKDALARLRQAGVLVGLVSNQSGVASGRLTVEQVDAVNQRIEADLGPFDTVRWCPHGPEDACGCRKPAPGLVLQACADLGVNPSRCVLIGDIATDVRAAAAAGSVGILVPAAATSPEDLAVTTRVHRDLAGAVTAILGGQW